MMFEHADETNLQTPAGAVRGAPQAAAAPEEWAGPHILVPMKLVPADRETLSLALRIAAERGSRVTALHVATQAPGGPSMNWLDAIDDLHRALERPGRAAAAESADQAIAWGRSEVQAFVQRMLPTAELSSVPLRVDCRLGNIPEAIARYAEETSVDLIVLGSDPRPWWEAWMAPSLLPQILKRTRKPVLLLRRDADGPDGAANAARAMAGVCEHVTPNQPPSRPTGPPLTPQASPRR